jgi:serine/threonine protein kinase
LPPETIKRIMREILKGLNYLHHNGIMHRNLKPENVILSETTEEIKITDYALSKEVLIPHVP